MTTTDPPVQGSPPAGTIMVPMNPAPGVATTAMWQPAQLPDGTPVAVVFFLAGAVTMKVEFSESMADAFIEGLRSIFGKPTLAVARTMPPDPPTQNGLRSV